MAQTGPTPGPQAPPESQTGASVPALVERARGGDMAAYRALVDGRLPASWRLARAVLPTDEAAGDAVHNAMLAAWRELPRLDDPSRFDDWLDRILLAECRMRLAGDGSGVGAGGAVPGGLAERLDGALRAAPPRPPVMGRGRSSGASWPAILLALVSVLAVAAVISVGVPWLRDRVAPPSVVPVVEATAAPTATEAPATPLPTRVPEATGVPAVAPQSLDVGVIAMVTLDGDNLRVRSAPGTADDTTRLRPLLPAGTRMLIVGGPVEVDGYTWYEVKTEGDLVELVDLFGWVAAGDGEVPWIAPTAPRCFGGLDAAAATSMSRIDFLVCHRDAEVRLQADARALWDEDPPASECGWVRDGDGCDVDHPWLLFPSGAVTVSLPGGEAKDLVVALPPDLAAQLRKLPRQTMLTLTVSLDSPESMGCGIRDATTGEALLPDDRAITACRLQFVVQEVAFRQ